MKKENRIFEYADVWLHNNEPYNLNSLWIYIKDDIMEIRVFVDGKWESIISNKDISNYLTKVEESNKQLKNYIDTQLQNYRQDLFVLKSKIDKL